MSVRRGIRIMMRFLRHRRRMIREFERWVRKRWVFLYAFLALGNDDNMYELMSLGVRCRNYVQINVM